MAGTADVGSYNAEVALSIENLEILSGEKNYAMIELKTTGAKAAFTDVVAVLEYNNPELLAFDIEHLETIIQGKFDSYDFSTELVEGEHVGKLTLRASTLQSGRYYELPVIFTTLNGETPDSKLFTFALEFTSAQLSPRL